MPGARAVSFIDEIAVILPPELSLDMAVIVKVTEWLQERLGVEGISLNRRKSPALLADGVGPEHLTEEQRTAMDNTGLTVARQGMGVFGVPVGTEQFKRDFLQDAVSGEPDEVVRVLVSMEDAQASFQILRLSAAKIRPTWDTMPYGRPTCPTEKAALDLPAAAPSKARPTSVATPWSWSVPSLPPPGRTFHPFSNGCLSDP